MTFNDFWHISEMMEDDKTNLVLWANCRVLTSALDFGQVCQRYQQGDKIVRHEVKSVVDYLGIAIANLLNNNPVEQLASTGGILRLGQDFQSSLEKKIGSILFNSVKTEMMMLFLQPEQEDPLACGAAIFAGRHANVFQLSHE